MSYLFERWKREKTFTMKWGYNSTIAKKERICKVCGKPCYWFSKQRCQSCAIREDVMKRMEVANEKMIVEEDLSGLIEDADRVFSQYTRLKYADNLGIVDCYTCGDRKHWTMQQAGHFIKRGHLYLRWDGRNVRPQCSLCNEMKYGNIEQYSKRLEAECRGLPDILRDESRIVHKPTRDEIRAVISEYTPKVKALKLKIKH